MSATTRIFAGQTMSGLLSEPAERHAVVLKGRPEFAICDGVIRLAGRARYALPAPVGAHRVLD